MNSKHILTHCNLCEEDTVVCATCGNNCCNGGYGEVNGQKCPDCPEAYDHQDVVRKDPDSIRFSLDERLAARRQALG